MYFLGNLQEFLRRYDRLVKVCLPPFPLPGLPLGPPPVLGFPPLGAFPGVYPLLGPSLPWPFLGPLLGLSPLSPSPPCAPLASAFPGAPLTPLGLLGSGLLWSLPGPPCALYVPPCSFPSPLGRLALGPWAMGPWSRCPKIQCSS